MWVVVPPNAIPRVSSSGPRVIGGLIGMAHDGVRKMSVRIDAARYDDEPCGIDDPRGARRQHAGRHHGRDAFTLDRDVPRPHALGRDHLPAAHDQINHGRSLTEPPPTVNDAPRSGPDVWASDTEPRPNR